MVQQYHQYSLFPVRYYGATVSPILTLSCALLWCNSITSAQITPLITFMLLTVVCAMIAIPYFIIFCAEMFL
jgi:hypothetical protein